jgi:type IV pilus assembly protein PilM
MSAISSSFFTPLKKIWDLDLSTLVGSKQLLGLDIGSSGIKIVQIKESKGRLRLQKFGIMPLSPDVIVDGTVMDSSKVVAAIKDLVREHGVKLKKAALSISGHSVIVKKISLPVMPEDELEIQVRLAAEQYIPFDINEVNLDFHILNPMESSDDGGATMSLLLVAAKKEKVVELSELVLAAGLEPAVLDVDAFAIENMYDVNYETGQEELVALVNVGASVMNVNILKGGTSVFTRDISLGGNRYTEALQRKMGLNYLEAEEVKRTHQREGFEEDVVLSVLEDVNAEVASEIARSVDYFRTTSLEREIQKIVLCGGSAQVAGLAQQLSDRMGLEVEMADPFRHIDVSGLGLDPDQLIETAPLAAVGVGLALRTLGDR